MVTSTPESSCIRRTRPGFTLVELLVVILIIALLITLLLGAVHLAQNKSRIAKTKADLAAIATALEQYHSDFRTYPGVSEPITTRTILAQALIAPDSAAKDGADGPGFRIPDPGTNPPAFSPNSKKWEAYLSPEHFKVQQFPPATATKPAGPWAIVDYFGNPIRYYPKRRNFNPIVGPLIGAGGIFDNTDGEHPEFGYSPALESNHQVLSAATLAKYLGDNNGSNTIDAGESYHPQSEYILASSGPDGLFTLVNEDPKLNRSDDILNFDYK